MDTAVVVKFKRNYGNANYLQTLVVVTFLIQPRVLVTSLENFLFILQAGCNTHVRACCVEYIINRRWLVIVY